jgi:MFS family permease
MVREEADGPDRFRCAEGPFDHYERTLLVADAPDGLHLVSETIDWDLAIPLWGGLFRPLLRRRLRRTEAPAPPPAPGEPEPASPWWSPPARLDARAARILSLLCGVSMLAGYLGTIITQTITFASDEFGTGRSAQGTTLAAVRVGVLLSLVLVGLSDRKGRRKLLVASAVGGAVAAAAGALAPNLWVLGGTQTVSRAFSTALGILIVVVAAEEMPAGGRAYAASVLAMTAALGAGGAVILLPLADLAEPAWRIIYVVPLLALPLFLKVAKQIPESRRFTRPHGKATLAGHRGRLLLLATASFFGLLFLAPASQFQNEFLRDEQGFPAILITVFTLATNTPAGIGIVIGGRLADVRGRRLVGTVGTLGGAALFVLAYQSHGPLLWLFTLLGTVIAASTVPALGVYGPELFPTALRGRANGLITLAGVLGSGTGLAIEGHLADRWGRIGPGIAVLGVGPLVVAGLVILLYPETAHLELEDLNPEDAVATAIAPPML